MLVYVVKRLGHTVIIILSVLIIVFALLRLGGDPSAFLLPPDAPASAREELRVSLGLDQPIPLQFIRYLQEIASGSFGDSLRWRRPAIELILDRVPATLRLTGVAMAVSLAFALPLGIMAAVAAHRRRRWIDTLAMGFVLIGQSMPTFWFGLMLIFVFALTLRWLPPSGADGWTSLILPGVTLGFYSSAIVARLLRSNVLEMLSQDFVRTARAKGVREVTILARHVARNAAIPVVTILGLQVGTLLGGAVVTEYVFSYPGIGLLTLDAISQRDFPIVQGFVVLMALVITLINLVVDLAYAALDPRIRY